MSLLNYLDPYPNAAPAVLLLHGLGANCSSWGYQIESLHEAGFRPVAPDLPGFGKSVYDGKGWSFKRVSQDLVNLLGELQTGPVHVVGLSMGGVIAQQFALDYPQLVRKLVLVSTFSMLQPEGLSQWFYFAQRALVVHTLGLKTQSKFVAKRVFPDQAQQELREMAEQQIAAADVRAYRAAMRNLGLFNSLKRLKEINIPTLVISGENDSTVTPARQKTLTDGIKGARQVVILHAGHAVAIDQFAAFNHELLSFL